MKNKKAQFAEIDFMLAIAILGVGLILITVPFIHVREDSQADRLSYDAVNMLATMKVKDLNISLQQEINTRFETFDIRYSDDESVSSILTKLLVKHEETINNDILSYTRELSEKILSPIIPDRFKFEVFVYSGGDKYDLKTIPDYEKTYVASQSRTMLSGLEVGRPITGFVSSAEIQTARKIDSAYAFFGGFIGQGDIALKIEVPDENYDSIEGVYIEGYFRSSFDVYVNDNNNHCQQILVDNSGGFVSQNLNPGCRNSAQQGYNNIIIEFDTEDLTKKYVSGGFVRIDYNVDKPVIDSVPDLVTEKRYLTGIFSKDDGESLINIYDGFFVPGELESLRVYLEHDVSINLTETEGLPFNPDTQNPSNLTMTIGDMIIYENQKKGPEIFNKEFTDGEDFNFSDFNNSTIPFRVAFPDLEITGTVEGQGIDIMLVTDLTRSMMTFTDSTREEEWVDCSYYHNLSFRVDPQITTNDFPDGCVGNPDNYVHSGDTNTRQRRWRLQDAPSSGGNSWNWLWFDSNQGVGYWQDNFVWKDYFWEFDDWKVENWDFPVDQCEHTQGEPFGHDEDVDESYCNFQHTRWYDWFHCSYTATPHGSNVVVSTDDPGEYPCDKAIRSWDAEKHDGDCDGSVTACTFRSNTAINLPTSNNRCGGIVNGLSYADACAICDSTHACTYSDYEYVHTHTEHRNTSWRSSRPIQDLATKEEDCNLAFFEATLDCENEDSDYYDDRYCEAYRKYLDGVDGAANLEDWWRIVEWVEGDGDECKYQVPMDVSCVNEFSNCQFALDSDYSCEIGSSPCYNFIDYMYERYGNFSWSITRSLTGNGMALNTSFVVESAGWGYQQEIYNKTFNRSRLEVVKIANTQFINHVFEKSPQARVGLSAYDDLVEDYMYHPFSSNKDSLLSTVAGYKINNIGTKGSSFGAGLSNATNEFNNSGLPDRNRAMVLLSDGDNNAFAPVHYFDHDFCSNKDFFEDFAGPHPFDTSLVINANHISQIFSVWQQHFNLSLYDINQSDYYDDLYASDLDLGTFNFSDLSLIQDLETNNPDVFDDLADLAMLFIGAYGEALCYTFYANQELDVSIYTVGFALDLDKEPYADRQIRALAAVDNASHFYLADDLDSLLDVFEFIVEALDISGVEYQSQVGNLSVDFESFDATISEDSYIEYSYKPHNVFDHVGKFRTTQEYTFADESCNQDFVWPFGSNVIPGSGFLSVYSNFLWSTNILFNNENIYNTGSFSELIRILLGDPFMIGVPQNLFNQGTNQISVSFQGVDEGDDDVTCEHNKLIYEAYFPAVYSAIGVREKAQGCRWTLPNEDSLDIPFDYNHVEFGNNCEFNSIGDHNFDDTDSYQRLGFELFSSLSDESGEMIVDLSNSEISWEVREVDDVPYLWGPALLGVTIWR